MKPQQTDKKYLPLINKFINLADHRLGARVLDASDDFFAEKENLLSLTEPVFIDDKFTPRGKWMDGWESRRKRVPGHDWCTIKLAMPGTIGVIDINTAHFLGNAPLEVSIEATGIANPSDKDWESIVTKHKVMAGNHNFSLVKSKNTYRFLRINIFPDGGVARIKVYGAGEIDWDNFVPGELIDLAAAENGGRSVACSDMFYSPKDNIIMPGRGATMGDGWETKRRRGAGNDWNIIRLAASGKIKKVAVDTTHFKGNFPESFSLEGCFIKQSDPSPQLVAKQKWQPIIKRTTLNEDEKRIFIKEIINTKTNYNYARINIYPDGGINRLNIFATTDR